MKCCKLCGKTHKKPVVPKVCNRCLMARFHPQMRHFMILNRKEEVVIR